MNKLAHFELSNDAILVNGQDVTANVTALRFTRTSTDVGRLELEMIGDATITGDGIAYVSQPTPDEILRFLSSVNPAQVEQEVLGRLGWDEDKTVSQITLEVLGEMCRGSST
jgi:hypothetical protein